ncbi:LysR family transcriptional regulator, partial [Porphyromonas gingivalis]|uniref:LysR family transcriptional regulator n=1 Tax=Porphyromonas gingivalis TaxID=837 RepID=UPI001F3D3627
MNIQQLEYIAALDKFRHFAKAADYCNVSQPTLSTMILKLRPLHGDWCVFCLLIHCIIGSYFVYLSIKNSIILLPWHTNPR